MDNQASEYELERYHLRTCDKYEILRGIYPNDRRLTGNPCSCGIESLIRTEKLKAQTDILQEGVSESKEFCGEDVDINLGWVNFKLNELQQSLTKLETEL